MPSNSYTNMNKLCLTQVIMDGWLLGLTWSRNVCTERLDIRAQGGLHLDMLYQTGGL